MATSKRKLKLKPKKQTIKKIRRHPATLIGAITSVLLIGFALGLLTIKLKPYDQHPQNVVWAADKSVVMPRDLQTFLLKRDDCQNYRGANTASGVGLWGVFQVSKGRFAKISYGCSTNLNLYTMAVKQDGNWLLLRSADYFATTGYLPKCSQLELYKIDASIEPICVGDNNLARDNTIK